MISRTPEDILLNSQVDIIRDNDDEGTADASKDGFRDYCIAEITLMMNTREFKSTYLVLKDEILSYDIRVRLLFVRELLYAFSGKYEVPYFVVMNLMGSSPQVSVLSEEDVDNILEFIEFIEFRCSDILAEALYKFVKDKQYDTEQIINSASVDFLREFLNLVGKNKNKLPKLFVNLVSLVSADTLRTLLLKMALNNRDEVFVKIRLAKLSNE